MLKEIDIEPTGTRRRVTVTAHGAGDRVAAAAAPAEEGIPTLVHHTVDDVKELVAAEIALYKAKAQERISAYTSAAIFFGAAAVLALSAVTALLVGLILSLATLIGPLAATAVVVIGTLVIAGILAMIGKGKLAPAKGGKK